MANKESQVQDDLNSEVTKPKWKSDPRFKILLKGLIVTLPIIIMIALVSVILNLIFTVISPVSYLISPGSTEPHWTFHILSLIILVILFYLIGLSVTNRMGRYYKGFIEREYLVHIPLYTTLRDLVRQFTGLEKMPFSQVVLIDPFDSGVLMTGFVTEQVTEDIYTVFVPTAPNPTNGNIYHVPKTRLKFLTATSDEAMRTIVGMGTGSSCLFSSDEISQLTENID